MWLLGGKVLDYLNDDRVSIEKRRDTFLKRKSKVIKEIEKLTDLEIVNYLFSSKLDSEVRLLICDEVSKLAVKTDKASVIRFNNIRNSFIRQYGYDEDVLELEYCPKRFKRLVVENVYGSNLVEVILDENVPFKKKFAIIEVKLNLEDAVTLLKKDIPMSLKTCIIDNVINSEKDIRNCIGNVNLPEDVKEKIVERKITMANMFNFTKQNYHNEADLIYRVKSREIDEYISSLTVSSILRFINRVNIPVDIVEKVVDQKSDMLRSALNIALPKQIEATFRFAKDRRIVDLILENRMDTFYQVLRELDSKELLSWLNSGYLPLDLKEYLISYHGDELDECIDNLSLTKIEFYLLSKKSNLPVEVKEKIFEVHKSGFINKFQNYNEDEIINTIKFGSQGFLLKKLLIELRINRYNIFELLSQYNLSEEIIDIVFSTKVDVLKDIVKRKTLDDLTKLNDVSLSENLKNRIIDACKDVVLSKINSVDKDVIYKYLCNGNILLSIRKLMLSSFGVYDDDLQNCLEVIEPSNIGLLLSNYNEIKEFIESLGISFNSFLQYGSGSKKYSNWLVNLNDIIHSDKEEFVKCMNYFFNNYYSEYKSKDNAVYMIANFLEFIENYFRYHDLCINLQKNGTILTKQDELNIKFLFNVKNVDDVEVPKTLEELSVFKEKLYEGYVNKIRNNNLTIEEIKQIFNDLLFCNASVVHNFIGGSGSLRSLIKDNAGDLSIETIARELMLYSRIIEMVNDSNNLEGLTDLLEYIFSNIDILTEIQNIFSEFEKKVDKLYELDSKNNLTKLSKARNVDGVLDLELSNKYGGEVYDFSDKNYALYAHVLSFKDDIESLLEGKSSGNSNFISVSPVSYRGQKYYWDSSVLILAYDTIPTGSFVCSSVFNMGSNKNISCNSSEVEQLSRKQRGILETSAVVQNNSEALLYREGLKPCGLILPGGREPTEMELAYHKKYNLPFIITQDVMKCVDNPKRVLKKDEENVEIDNNSKELEAIIDILELSATIDKEDDVYTGREVGLLTDCHSMYEPTLVALEDMRRHGISEIYSLGDNIGFGPNPCETFDLLEDYGVVSIAGNSEYYATLGTEPFSYFYDEKKKSQEWTERKLGPDRISKLRLYPASIDLFMGDKKIALCHFANDVRCDYTDRGTHAYQNNYIYGRASRQFLYTNSDEAREEIDTMLRDSEDDKSLAGYVASKNDPLFGGKRVTDYDAVIQGHVHFDMKDKIGDTDIHTLRAVGMGFSERDSQCACYYVLREKKDGTFDIVRRDLPFNKNNFLSNVYTSDLPEKDKVIQFVKTNTVWD